MDALRPIALALYDVGCLIADKIDKRKLPPPIAYGLFTHWGGTVRVPPSVMARGGWDQ